MSSNTYCMLVHNAVARGIVFITIPPKDNFISQFIWLETGVQEWNWRQLSIVLMVSKTSDTS